VQIGGREDFHLSQAYHTRLLKPDSLGSSSHSQLNDLMAHRRDWDKVGRERRGYEHGMLPVWQDGWTAGEPEYTPPPKAAAKPILTTPRRSHFLMRYDAVPYRDFDLVSLFGFFGQQIPYSFSVRIERITFICPKLPEEVHSLLYRLQFTDHWEALRLLGVFAYPRKKVQSGNSSRLENDPLPILSIVTTTCMSMRLK
jgi:hypothetical protein